MTKRKRPRDKPTCYICGRPKTSREHIPPQCFFPERDEFRKNLITVPSCDDHNSQKSHDDEYMLSIIAPHLENNDIAQEVFGKIIRSIKHRPWLTATFFRGLFPALVRGKFTGAFFVDRPRFDRCMEFMSKGIYFYHFEKRSHGPVGVLSYSLSDIRSERRNEINRALNQWRKYSTKATANLHRYGENQQVFYYQIFEDDTDRKVIRMVFYEGVVVDVLLFGDELNPD